MDRNKSYITQVFIIAIVLLLMGCQQALDLVDSTQDTPISINEIYITPPAANKTPVTRVNETDEFTGIVSWSPADNTFVYGQEYSAKITLTPKDGFTLSGVPANFFTVIEAERVTHTANPVLIVASFPAIEAQPPEDSSKENSSPVTEEPATEESPAEHEFVEDSEKNSDGQTLEAVTFMDVIQEEGIDGKANSKALSLTFSVDPTTLTTDNISLTGATKGELSGTGTTRMLGISEIKVGNGESVSVSITSPSGFTLTGSPQTAVVYRNTITTVTLLSVVENGGTSGTADSTNLIMTFDGDPTTLTAADISVTGATKGQLSGTGMTRTLTISDITVGNEEAVSVEIVSPSGYVLTGSSQTALVYRDIRVPVTLLSVIDNRDGTANGSWTLTLNFDIDPSTLTVEDITVTGATKEVLSGAGTTRTLVLSNRFIGNINTVTVNIADPDGFTIFGSPKSPVDRVYEIGEEGPAGGIVFYDSDKHSDLEIPLLPQWEIECLNDIGRRWYMEAWTVDEDGSYEWGLGTGGNMRYMTLSIFGSGRDNTVRQISQELIHPAAEAARNANHGGYSDWFLPSKYELLLMYQQREVIGNFTDRVYWSSSEVDRDRMGCQDPKTTQSGVWAYNFRSGFWLQRLRGEPNNVRVIRRF